MKRYIGLVVLIAALIGLVYTIERTARAPMQRPPATAAAGQPQMPPGGPGMMPGAPGAAPGEPGPPGAMPGAPGATPGEPGASGYSPAPGPPGVMPGHEGHAHGPGDGHNH